MNSILHEFHSVAQYFMPHGHCMLWQKELIWLHVGSDLVIAASYYSIPIALVYFVHKRKDLVFNWMFIMFGVFIFACGTTHLMNVWTMWQPYYWLEGIVKMVTGTVSMITAVALWPLIPRALRLPSPRQLQIVNEKLEEEIKEKNRVADELRLAQDRLEHRIQERTEELWQANQSLQREISERNQAEEKFRLAVEASPNGMIMVDQSGTIVLVNSETEKLFGYDRSELVGAPIEMLVPNRFRGDHPHERAAFFATPSKRRMGAARDLHGRRKSGEEIPVEIGLNPVITDNGVFVLSSIIDITERKNAENRQTLYARELERSNAELEQFAYIASHDLRAPLRAINKLSLCIEEDLQDVMQNETREMMTLMRGRVDRMKQFLDDLLEFARVGKVQHQHEMVDVEKLIWYAISISSPWKHVSCNIVGPLPTFETLKVPLEQVFFNLIDNAVKHNDAAQPAVTVSVEELGDRFRFTIGDNGPGIDPVYHSRIFGMFQTLKPRDQKEGSGMGLAFVQKILLQYGGTIDLESTVGAGARFHFTWPKKIVFTTPPPP